MSNLFHKNTTNSSAQSSLASNPIMTNATAMNNEFLNHHKQQPIQQSFVQQPIQQSFVQQPMQQSFVQPTQQSFVQTRSIEQHAAPLHAAPMLPPPVPAALSGKKSRGHHHGIRSKRAQAVLPIQPIGGGPAIATLASQPIMQQQSFVQQPIQQSFAQTRSIEQQSFAHQSAETIMRPAIVQETVRTDRVVEVQPIVHREIDQSVVHHIERHITEAPAPARGGVVRMAPIVQQNMNTHVIDEITPIIHREVAVRQVERVEEHLSEHVTAPAQHTNSVLYESAPLPAAPISAPVISRELPARQPTLLAPISAPAQHETLTKTPIVQETLRTDKIVEVQPVVHREIDQQVVNHIEKHITEASAPAMGGVVRMAPIVQETRSTHVIDEIQPVVHRERVQVRADRVEEHVVEHVVAPTQHTNSIVNEGLSTSTFNQGLNNSSSLLNTSSLNQTAPLTNTTPIQQVVPNFASNNGLSLEKKVDALTLNNNSSTFGSAMM